MGRTEAEPVTASLQRIKEIRRENLRLLVAKYGGAAKLGLALGYSNGAFISQLISKKPPRTISERVARHIEDSLKLHHGWMDIPS
jgi:hypothetical protein